MALSFSSIVTKDEAGITILAFEEEDRDGDDNKCDDENNYSEEKQKGTTSSTL